MKNTAREGTWPRTSRGINGTSRRTDRAHGEIAKAETVNDSERALGALLQLAYSGELAAAYAYRGHWKSSSNAEERANIRKIEDEEWHHRERAGEMLAELSLAPSKLRELRAMAIGRFLGALCYVSGWFAPMYGAGKLESRNIREYESAARLARDCGRLEWVDCLLTMAEVEWDHERYFRNQIERHWLGKRLSIWKLPPERDSIRTRFESEAAECLS